MPNAKLTSGGRLTLPADVRHALDLKAGDRVEFVQVRPDRFERVPAARSVTALKGMFGTAQRVMSIDEMNGVIAEQGARAGLRGAVALEPRRRNKSSSPARASGRLAPDGCAGRRLAPDGCGSRRLAPDGSGCRRLAPDGCGRGQG